jgi:hypothetical protein
VLDRLAEDLLPGSDSFGISNEFDSVENNLFCEVTS